MGAATGATIGIAALLIIGPMTVGYCAFNLSLVRGENLDISRLFSGFGNFGTNFAAGLLMAIFTFLWSLLFFIPGIVKSYAYSMTPYILNDNPGMGPSEAITESRRMMNGHKWQLFVLHLSFLGWIILTALTCGILSIYVSPYMKATEAAFYEEIKGQTSSGEVNA